MGERNQLRQQEKGTERYGLDEAIVTGRRGQDIG
jgi:hypothetical protein